MRNTTAAWLMLTTALASAGATLWLTRPVPATHDIDPIVIVGELQSVAKLQTVVVPLQTTVHGSRGEGVFKTLAGEELVFQGIGEARAGVDLALIEPDDVWIDGHGALWIELPPGEIFGVDLDDERSHVLARQQGWLGRADPQFETNARRAALGQLTAQAQELGLEDRARDDAESAISDLLQTFGVTEVRFPDRGRVPTSDS